MCVYFFQHQAERVLVEEDNPKVRLSPDAFKWQPKFDQINATKIKTCRNSVQGKTLIADERGNSAVKPGLRSLQPQTF